MSDATRRMIDEEQQYITDLAHRRALKLVAENRDAARGVRLHAARERGARARGHRADLVLRLDQGQDVAQLARAAEPGRPTIAAAEGTSSRAASRPPWSKARGGRRPGAAWSRAGAAPARREPPAAGRSRGPEATSTPPPVFGRIDHIGVAVEDLDGGRRALLATASACRGSTARRSRSRASRPCCSGVGDSHVELLARSVPDTRRRPVPGAQRPGHAPRGLPDRRHRRRARAAARGGPAADRRAAAHRASGAAAWRSCTRSPPAACSPSSWNRRKGIDDGGQRSRGSTSASRAARCCRRG